MIKPQIITDDTELAFYRMLLQTVSLEFSLLTIFCRIPNKMKMWVTHKRKASITQVIEDNKGSGKCGEMYLGDTKTKDKVLRDNDKVLQAQEDLIMRAARRFIQ